MPGITFDTGALIALEGAGKRIKTIVKGAHDNDRTITVPAVVLIEWFRDDRTRRQRALLKDLSVEPLDARIAMAAGVAIANVPSATAIDAAVMASAASRGDIVYTSDPRDLERLRDHFPTVRVFKV